MYTITIGYHRDLYYTQIYKDVMKLIRITSFLDPLYEQNQTQHKTYLRP